MARIASWRARRDDPRTVVGWASRDEGSRWLPLPLAFVLMMVAGGLAVGWSAWAILLVPAIALHVRRTSSEAEGLDALATVPPPGPSFRVRLEVREAGGLGQGLLLGVDDGIVTFVEGWLHYAGRRTEFSFRREDAVAFFLWRNHWKMIMRRGGDVCFRPLDPADGEALGRALGVWFRATPVPEGESILPPRGIHPSGVVRAWRDATTATLAAVVGAFVFVRWIGFGGVFVFLPTSFEVYRRLGRARVLRRAARANERRAALGP